MHPAYTVWAVWPASPWRIVRDRVAAHLCAHPSEIIFTSGGTESDNAAIRGMLEHTEKRLLTSAAEHAAVLGSARALQARGIPVILLRPNADGSVSAAQVEEALTPADRLGFGCPRQ